MNDNDFDDESLGPIPMEFADIRIAGETTEAVLRQLNTRKDRWSRTHTELNPTSSIHLTCPKTRSCVQ